LAIAGVGAGAGVAAYELAKDTGGEQVDQKKEEAKQKLEENKNKAKDKLNFF
jgi:hypothetical protein